MDGRARRLRMARDGEGTSSGEILGATTDAGGDRMIEATAALASAPSG